MFAHNYGIIIPKRGGGTMPHIIPIRDLKNTGGISQLCHESPEPIYITKNGYGDMVIMSMQMYEEKLYMLDVYNRLSESEADVAAGRTKDARESLKSIRERYNV
jgi:PHD/YefM family antitoxin component YafN of YafNO toxin-antitoxin module